MRDEDAVRERNDWAEDSKIAHKSAAKDQTEYDKQLLTLSTGFLAISLAFVKDVVPLEKAAYRGFLYSSFCLLGLAILLVLFSYQFSIAGNIRVRDYWELKKAGEYPGEFPYTHARRAGYLNRACGCVFALGVASAITFAIINIHREAQMPNGSRIINEGSVIKTPALLSSETRGGVMKVPAVRPPSPTSPSKPTTEGAQK